MKRIIALLFLLSCLPAMAGVPYVLNPNGVGTNTTITTPTLGGPVTITNSAFKAGGFDAPFYFNRATGPSIGTFFGHDTGGDNLLLQGGFSGIWFNNRTSSKVWGTWGTDITGNAFDDVLHFYYGSRQAGSATVGDIMVGRPGTLETVFIPFVGGSVGTASGIPIHNDEMAQRIPKLMVYLYGTPTTEAYLTSNITGGIASGVIPTLQSFGAQIAVDCEPGWQQSIRNPDTGRLMWETNNFPDGPVLFCRKMHTNQVQVILHQYVESIITNGDFYVTDPNMPTASHNMPATTFDRITKDVVSGYEWGIDAFRWADNDTSFSYTTPYMESVMRLFNDEVLHPRGIDYKDLGYTNAMHTEFFLGHGTVKIPASAAYECPAFFTDQSQGAGVSGDFTRAIDQMRVTYTNLAWMEGKGHFISFTMPIGLTSSSANNSMWADVRACQASLAAAVIFPGAWTLPGFTNAWWSTYVGTITNATMLRMMFDSAYYPGFPVWNTGVGGHSCWIKPLANGDYALAMANESGGDLNLTLNWATNLVSPASFLPAHGGGAYPLMIASNQVFTVYDAFNATNQVCVGGTFTAAITNGGCSLFRMVRNGIVGNSDWSVSMVSGSDATTTGQSLVDVTGLTFSAAANTTYEFRAVLNCTTTAVTTGTEYGLANVGTAMTTVFTATGATNAATGATYFVSATNAATQPFLLASGQSGIVVLEGQFTMGATAGNVTVRHLKVTSGTSTVKQGSSFKVRKLL